MARPFGRTKSNEPYRFLELADYNARISKGIVHTPEYVAHMVEEQRLFNEWALRGFPENDVPPIQGGAFGVALALARLAGR